MPLKSLFVLLSLCLGGVANTNTDSLLVPDAQIGKSSRYCLSYGRVDVREGHRKDAQKYHAKRGLDQRYGTVTSCVFFFSRTCM